MSRSGEIAIADTRGRERERYKLPYGAVIFVNEAVDVDAGQLIARWDPHMHPVITEVAGKVVFQDMEEGVTIDRQTDELTGLINISVLDPRDRPTAGKDLRPSVRLVDEEGEDVNLAGTDVPAALPAPERCDPAPGRRGRRSVSEMSLLASRKRAPAVETSPVVCLGLRIYSKRVSPRSPPSWRKAPGP